MALTRRTPQDASPPPAQVAAQEDEALESGLRPKILSEYIGQRRIKEHLLVHMEAARTRKEPLGHVLLHGPPGLGKTTLAHIIAQEMSATIRISSGPSIEKPGDLASLLTNLQAGDVLFIDEIHRLRPVIEEVLYGAMEDCKLDIMIGKGPTARSVRLNLQPFTLVGATTKAGAISSPLRDRFLHQFKLAFYEDEEMKQIVDRSAKILGMEIQPSAARRIALSSRATPRIGNSLVRSVRDFAQVKGDRIIDLSRVEETLRSLEIDEEGLHRSDHLLLQTIVDTFAGGPVGLSTLSAVLAEEQDTIEHVYEPFLLQQGYLQRTAKGRVATRRAYEKLGRVMPEEVQATMTL